MPTMKVFHLFNKVTQQRATVISDSAENALKYMGWPQDCIEGFQDAEAYLVQRTDTSDHTRSSDKKEVVL